MAEDQSGAPGAPAPGPARPRVLGAVVDDQTRCLHHRTALDVVALQLPCCGEFYPCHRCHQESADHPARPWPRGSHDVRPVLCGVCGRRLGIAEYLAADRCPGCHAPFNPGCRLHTELYFTV